MLILSQVRDACVEIQHGITLHACFEDFILTEIISTMYLVFSVLRILQGCFLQLTQ